jgi:PBSX family phage portal protein
MDTSKTNPAAPATVESFRFGEPESVIGRHWLDYLGVFAHHNGEYYIPPFSMAGLAKMRNANAHHGSCLLFRRNMLANTYRGHPGFSLLAFRNLAYDYLTFGNAYLQILRNIFGQIVGLRHIPALNMRVRPDENGFRLFTDGGSHVDFGADDVRQISEYDPMQQIYGLPDWLGGLQSALLNEDATLFRRRYYVNGAHLGYIFYTSDAQLDPKVQELLKEQIRRGKGVGNFRSMYMHLPNGKEKSVQIIPIGDISQKDQFQSIKNISADDVLVAHRVPGALAGVRPTNVTGDGDVAAKRIVYLQTETAALAQPFQALNDELPANLRFVFDLPTGEAD